MSHYQQPTPDDKDPVLWKIAQKRAGFKKHAIVYAIVNIFLWVQWFLIENEIYNGRGNIYPWPIWTTLGWGVGLAFHFASAYVFSQTDSTEREYQKLKNKQ